MGKKLLSATLICSLAGIGLVAGSVGAAAPASAAVIVSVCTVKTNYAHGSTHVSGTINVEGNINCTDVMPEIYLRTTLRKTSNNKSWQGTPKDYFNATTFSTFASTSCNRAPGSFRGETYYSLRFPPGYTPATAKGTVSGAITSVNCNGANLLPEQPREAETVVVRSTIMAPGSQVPNPGSVQPELF
ncbi:hypothetical protein GCM10023166_08100 [Paeniglutamicibacter cryotolerans]|uniref:Spore coat protein U domain-containing protein n=1 Tax=Paeniglutamicibacter cryotolerans TaxID=670079 RepID=A0A839QMW2_9MICC|nr:hypothetical protein [Paeniglutamicibacter cryotolerans]